MRVRVQTKLILSVCLLVISCQAFSQKSDSTHAPFAARNAFCGELSGTYTFYVNGANQFTNDLSTYNAMYSPGTPSDVIEVYAHPAVSGATSYTWAATTNTHNNPFSFNSTTGELYFELGSSHTDNVTYNLTVTTSCGTVSQDVFFEISDYAGGATRVNKQK